MARERSPESEIEAKSDGSVEVITGVASLGQGVETAIAQICADALGVNYGNIKVIHGQTNRIDQGMAPLLRASP